MEDRPFDRQTRERLDHARITVARTIHVGDWTRLQIERHWLSTGFLLFVI